MPGVEPTHHAFPVVTLAPIEGGVKFANDPFRLRVGKNSIDGSSDIFPLSLHVEGLGDSLAGRPEIEIDVDCAASNPLFLQGENGYVGTGTSSGPAWYYYSWANQKTTGSVKIDNQCYKVASGVAWMDHQWGGWPVPPTSTKPVGGGGWCWFEFQFDDGDRALTLATPHNGTIPPAAFTFGVYVEGKSSRLVEATLDVAKYAKSPETDANYPTEWRIFVNSNGIELKLDVTTVCEQQALWQGGLTEYAEAASTVKATGSIDGKAVVLEGVGYCESVGLEDPVEVDTRRKMWLLSSLQKDQ
jgi:predicted secreted hydrolase